MSINTLAVKEMSNVAENGKSANHITEEQKQKILPIIENYQRLCDVIGNYSMDEILIVFRAVQLKQLLDRQNMPTDSELAEINSIIDFNSENGFFWVALQAYQYGYIQGKRSERVRNKEKSLQIVKTSY